MPNLRDAAAQPRQQHGNVPRIGQEVDGNAAHAAADDRARQVHPAPGQMNFEIDIQAVINGQDGGNDAILHLEGPQPVPRDPLQQYWSFFKAQQNVLQRNPDIILEDVAVFLAVELKHLRQFKNELFLLHKKYISSSILINRFQTPESWRARGPFETALNAVSAGVLELKELISDDEASHCTTAIRKCLHEVWRKSILAKMQQLSEKAKRVTIQMAQVGNPPRSTLERLLPKAKQLSHRIGEEASKFITKKTLERQTAATRAQMATRQAEDLSPLQQQQTVAALVHEQVERAIGMLTERGSKDRNATVENRNSYYRHNDTDAVKPTTPRVGRQQQQQRKAPSREDAARTPVRQRTRQGRKGRSNSNGKRGNPEPHSTGGGPRPNLRRSARNSRPRQGN